MNDMTEASRSVEDHGTKTFDRAEAAAFLKCSKSVVSQLFSSGVLPGAKIGRRMVFRQSDLESFLNAQIEQQTAAIREVRAMVEAARKSQRRRGRPRREIKFT